jgi:hypothetical protein
MQFYNLTRERLVGRYTFLSLPLPFSLSAAELHTNETHRATGVIFSVPHTHGDMPLHKGDIVTVAFDHYDHHGVPVDAAISKIRRDLTWSQVFLSSDQSNSQFLDRMLFLFPHIFA